MILLNRDRLIDGEQADSSGGRGGCGVEGLSKKERKNPWTRTVVWGLQGVAWGGGGRGHGR